MSSSMLEILERLYGLGVCDGSVQVGDPKEAIVGEPPTASAVCDFSVFFDAQDVVLSFVAIPGPQLAHATGDAVVSFASVSMLST